MFIVIGMRLNEENALYQSLIIRVKFYQNTPVQVNDD